MPLAGPSDVDDAVRAAHDGVRDVAGRGRRGSAATCSSGSADLLERRTRRAGPPVGARQRHDLRHRPVHRHARSCDYTRYYAGWADKIEGRVTSSPAHGRELAYTAPEPYGVIGIIITWNGPLVSIGMKVIPALAAGNTVVVKPSELTPYATEHFMDLVREAGIPAGVVNVLPGTAEAGEALVPPPARAEDQLHRRARRRPGASSPTARETLKPAVLELGGKSASLVFPDADLDAVAFIADRVGPPDARRPGLRAGHPAGRARQRVRRARRRRSWRSRGDITLGDPFDPATGMGPVVSRAAQERILGDDRASPGRRLRQAAARRRRPRR